MHRAKYLNSRANSLKSWPDYLNASFVRMCVVLSVVVYEVSVFGYASDGDAQLLGRLAV